MQKHHQAHITFSGDEIPEEESAIVMANHRSWTDFYMIHSVAIRKKMLSNCKYFVKDSLKFLPFFGWGMWLMGMIFVKRNWVKDQAKINQMFATINEFKSPVWIISFVEGTRFTPQKLVDSQLFSQERGLPVMKNLLVPRTKGFVACVQKLRNSHVHYVYDLTIAYNHRLEGLRGFGIPPDMLRVHAGRLSPEYDFHIHVRRYPIAELPEEDEALAEWVHDRYVEKDRILERLKDKWIDGVEGGVWTESW
ncbi:acyltransferase-domain-containing protein [Jimgerdemannia flammicorona]|uniref:Acyltransferase-domain-containing protein n=1 Tax=Jimgerdemannia flammicorona TaxID=994334 RepID=A0A433DKH4_9FUNG|nr:acyltransferase-domain-containing protein [Jimgerdemannia flammicorona]